MSNINCKYCQSDNVIKYGKYKGVQRYFCKDCKRKFAGVDTIPKMQYPTDQISDVLNMYYEGMSLKEIRRNFIQQQLLRNHSWWYNPLKKLGGESKWAFLGLCLNLLMKFLLSLFCSGWRWFSYCHTFNTSLTIVAYPSVSFGVVL